MPYSTLAIIMVIPSILLFLLRLGLFFLERRFQTDQSGESQESYEAAGGSSMKSEKQAIYTSRNSDRAVRKAINELAQMHDTEILELSIKAFKKRPELWQVLYQEITQIPPKNTPRLEILEQEWRTQYTLISKKSKLGEDDFVASCSTLIWCIWYLNVANVPLLIADTWNAMGTAYHSLAILVPKRENECSRAALDCYHYALKLYCQSSNTYDMLEQQVKILCQMGKVSVFSIESKIDPVACWMIALDYLEQARALSGNDTNISFNLLSTIYFELGNTYDKLFQLLRKPDLLQHASAIYRELLILYQMRDPQNMETIQNINAQLDQFTGLNQSI